MKVSCKFSFALLTAALMMALPVASAIAQTAASDDDKKFVDDALKGGMAEVELGKLAEKKGASEDVKHFAAMMVADHTKLGDKMKVVAGEIGVTPPTMASVSGMATKTELEVLSGKTFDESYIKSMVKDHEDDLAAFKKEAAEGTSPEVKKAAHQGEMVVARHLEVIKKIAQAHNISM